MKKKNGFTLIELLAVIVVLAIIALIAVPIVLNLIERSRKGAAIDSAYGYKEAINEHYLSELIDNPNYILNGKYKVGSNGILINTQNEEESYNIEVSGSKPSNGEVTFVNNVMTEACLIISGYKVTLEDGKFTSSGKGECDSVQEEPLAKESPVDWFTFENHDDGTATITGFSEAYDTAIQNNEEGVKDIVIPSKSDTGSNVTIVGGIFQKVDEDSCVYDDDGNHNCNVKYSLDSIYLPDSIIEISDGSLAGLQLKNVRLGSNLQTIGNDAFAFSLNYLVNIDNLEGDYNNITEISIPNSVTTIGESAFSNNKLTSVTISDNVNTIARWAFAGNNIISLDLGTGVQIIGEYAFDSSHLTSVTIPNSVKEIRFEAFYNNHLISLDLGTGVQTIGESAFENNNLTSVIIPNSVITIGEDAFANNKLESVDLGNGVQSIGESAFAYNNITSIIIPKSVKTIEIWAFEKTSDSNPKLTTIINRTGKEFNWGCIVASSCSTYIFETGIVESDYGNVTVTKGNE